jgi:hypothetical protein
MNTGSLGTFVISWTNTEIDGVQSAPLSLLNVGATWRYAGPVVRVGGPQDVLILDDAEGAAEMRQRAARTVRRLVGTALAGRMPQNGVILEDDTYLDMPDQSFIVTDGHQSFTLSLIAVPDTGSHLLMAMGEVPPANRDLWIVRVSLAVNQTPVGAQLAGGVICFTPDTMISTENGPRAISMLQVGDRILTRDNGPQQVLWRGHRRMTGARLHVMPHLRPIRFASGALGLGRPDQDLLVSPQHRMLVKGQAAQALFNTPEVLVAAQDLVNDTTIMVDRSLREVTYVHILLEKHNVVWANGLETESFHPANTALDTVADDQRAGLIDIIPDVARNPQSYGDYARRNVNGAEAAILRHEMRQ